MTGLSNRADGEGGGSQPGRALDDIAQQNNLPGGMGGPLGGAGGGMTGSGPGTTPPSEGGGLSDPFSDVSGGGTGSGGATGSGGECSGGVCSSDTPVGNLFAYITISASLHVDPEAHGEDCNSLWPPKREEEICHYVRNSPSQKMEGLAAWFVGTAWALRDNSNEPGGGDGTIGEWVCFTQPVQPPIDPNLIPKVHVKAGRPFYSYSTEVYENTLVPSCSPSGKWLAETERIKVPYGPYPYSNNTWEFTVEALYPENGTWVSRGTKTLTIQCAWDSTAPGVTIKCEEQAPSVVPLHAAPVAAPASVLVNE